MNKIDWLNKQYPSGFGLGDLLREYIEYAFRQPHFKEDLQRMADIESLLNGKMELHKEK